MYFNKLGIICLICFFIQYQSFAQKKSQEIVTALNEFIKPIQTLKADSSFEDLDFLKEHLQDKEVIALGEGTHGTKEFFDYKDRLVRYLVSNLDYKAITFESDYIAIEKIDDYINGNSDQLIPLSGTALLFTNHKLIEWLKKYNLSQPVAKKVHLVGLEARGFTNISAKILAVIPQLSESETAILERFKTIPYSNIKKDDLNLLLAAIETLKKKANSVLHQHYINLLQQVALGYYQKNIGFRDAYMAENAAWAKENAEGKKLIVWAHNGHVAKTALYNEPAMGKHLYERYTTKYFVIATDFNHGEVRVRKYLAKNKPLQDFSPLYYPEVDSEKAYEYYFKQCKFKNFLIDVKTSSVHPILNTFFNRTLEMRMIGALSIPVNKKMAISENFDLIVFLNHTSST